MRTKVFYIQQNIGKAKYIVNFHDGVKTHRDGSEFYDIKTLKNKKDLSKFIQHLQMNGYTER